MTRPVRSILLGFIVFFGFCARAATYKAPLFDHHAWRQADTASVSRNFYRERLNILYPQVDHRGAQEYGYVETGLELFAFVVAAASKLIGFHHETGRILSALFFVASCLLVWNFVRRRYGDEQALAAAFLHAFAFPLLLFIERAFMNEALLICLSLSCLVAAQRYIEKGSTVSLWSLIAVSSAIAAIKLPYLIIWAPIVGLFLERYGRCAWRRWELWTMAVANVGFAGAWYSHAHRLAAMTGLSFGLTDKLFDAGIVFAFKFPYQILQRMVRDILEPVGLVVVLAGTWLAVRNRRWCEILGVLGFIAYLVIVAWGNAVHDYYQLALMPVASVLGATGVSWMSERLQQRFGGGRETILALLLGFAAVCTFVRLVSAHSWFEYAPGDVVMCEAIRRVSSQEDRLVFLGDNNPQMLFCVDRKGWLLASALSDERHLREAWQAGARWAVLARSVQDANVRRVLAETGRPLLVNDTVEVYRLR